MRMLRSHQTLSFPRWRILTTATVAAVVLLFLVQPTHQSFDYSSPPPPADPCSAYDSFLPPITNPRLFNAYTALQAWKHLITSDPNNFTANWCGPDVCNYRGVFCAPPPDDPYTVTVAGVDLNHANIAGSLPEELGLLTDLALFHLNSNRFNGKLPETLENLCLLHELDVSNNKFSGEFPAFVLTLPSLKFLDIRFNDFYGDIPQEVFDLKLDALFVNNNKFRSSLPENIGNSPVSVLVMANNDFRGCLPPSFYKMGRTLNQLILLNNRLTGCVKREIGLLNELTVLDLSFNSLVGPLPETIGDVKSLEQLNVAQNKFSGEIPKRICTLPKLENFTYSYNFFSGEPPVCLKLQDFDDQKNCIPHRPMQRSPDECKNFYAYPVDCGSFGCSPPPPPPPPAPPMHYDASFNLTV